MFRNEPWMDFTVAANRAQFQRALDELNKSVSAKKYEAFPLINGQKLRTASTIESRDPSHPDISLGAVHCCGEKETVLALDTLAAGARAWAYTPFARRAEIIRAAGADMRRERLRLAALIVREAGKPWKEADADVCEAIDFCDYYAEEMLRLGPPFRTQDVLGEDNTYFYVPRGIVAVIAPWNFPLAIACGMTTAALVTGNAVALKPSEQTTLIAYELAQALLRAGVPPDAFAFLPGPGRHIGKKMVEDPRVAMTCFTGSKEVGLDIITRSATVAGGQHHVKRVIAEMGGKNAVIVDEDADLDEAVRGVIYSAFGYSGQKCSACSRVIGVGDAYEPFMRRLTEAAADIIVGDAANPATLIGPIISPKAQERILGIISDAEKRDKLVFKGKTPAEGYFVPPAIFADVDTDSPIWREEIFGPVLSCRKAEDFDEAITLAVESEYALTGGLYSRSPSHIEQAREQFKVGNLYINRGCTGAMVCRQPFGGFAMSGVGSKAGGPDYLLQFMEPRTVSENTMRRGFAPELTS